MALIQSAGALLPPPVAPLAGCWHFDVCHALHGTHQCMRMLATRSAPAPCLHRDAHVGTGHAGSCPGASSPGCSPCNGRHGIPRCVAPTALWTPSSTLRSCTPQARYHASWTACTSALGPTRTGPHMVATIGARPTRLRPHARPPPRTCAGRARCMHAHGVCMLQRALAGNERCRI